MKKIIVLFCSALLSISVIGQNTKNHAGFKSKLFKQNELSLPGIDDKFLKFRNQNKSFKQLSHLKEAELARQRLDSVVSPGYDKDIFVYDALGNLLLDTYFEWDGSQWIKIWKEEYIHMENGSWTQSISSDWVMNEWVKTYKDEYSYDLNGNQTKYTSSYWDGSDWLNSNKDESVYDENNNVIHNTYYNGLGFPGEFWVEIYKDEFVYNETGKLIETIQYEWANDSWRTTMKMQFGFDESEKITQTFVFGWENENWTEWEKYETLYDINDNISEFVYFEWNGFEWVEAAKYIYEYDAGGNMTESNLVYFFEDLSIVFSKEEFVYDDYDNRVLYSLFAFDGENEDFLLSPTWRQEYEYDNNFSFEELILPFTSSDFESDFEVGFEGEPGQQDLNDMFKHKLTHLSYFEGDGVGWQMVGDYMLYYSEQNITGVNDLNLSSHVNLYPNPATNQITFNLDGLVGLFNIELYNIQGKLVMSKIGENNRPVSIETLNEGIYFYRLSENQNFYTGKFMIK
jgi:hypothetical protein